MKKKKVDVEVQYLYKCRHCNRIFPDSYSGTERAYENLVDAIYKISVNNQPPLPMITAHQCEQWAGGIADLIGYEIK